MDYEQYLNCVACFGKIQVHAEHMEDETHNQNVGDSTAVPVNLNSSPALTRKMGNIQHNSNPELAKLQWMKRRL